MKKKFNYFFKKQTDYIWLLIVIIISLSIQLLLLGNNIHNRIELSNTLDLSWQTDMVERFLHGYLAGKDFIFTYGPLFQFIYTLPALLFNQPSYIAILYAPILLTVLNTLLLFSLIKLATHERKAAVVVTAYLLFLIGIISYDPNNLLRILLPFLYGLLIFRFVSIKKIITLKTIGILALPTVLGMYTFDIFILCFMITILYVGYELYNASKNKKLKLQFKRYIFMGFSYVLLVIFFSILASLILSGSLNYLTYSFDTVQNYQFIMNIPWSIHNSSFLMIFPLALFLVLGFVIKKTKLNHDVKKAFVVLTIIALLQFKSAFIRSDDGHIIMGIYPSLIILFTLLYFVFREKIRLLFIIFFLCFYFLIPMKNNSYYTFSFNNFLSVLKSETMHKSFFSIYRFPQTYYYTPKDFQLFESLILKNPKNVMIFPYDNYLLNIYHTTYNTTALQFYQYSHSIVEEETVEQLKKSSPKFIILGIDDKGAVRLDNIPNFSRNPILTKWMLQNYSIDKKTEKYLILRFDPDKTKKQTRDNCSIYDIDTRGIMQTTIIERLFKPSTFYLENDAGIRLPYTPIIQEVFMIEQFNDPATLQKLFESNIDFKKYHVEEKRMKIIKKFPIPKVTKTFITDLLIKCY